MPCDSPTAASSVKFTSVVRSDQPGREKARVAPLPFSHGSRERTRMPALLLSAAAAAEKAGGVDPSLGATRFAELMRVAASAP